MNPKKLTTETLFLVHHVNVQHRTPERAREILVTYVRNIIDPDDVISENVKHYILPSDRNEIVCLNSKYIEDSEKLKEANELLAKIIRNAKSYLNINPPYGEVNHPEKDNNITDDTNDEHRLLFNNDY